jgi:hypothetical protein
MLGWKIAFAAMMCLSTAGVQAQELEAKININRSKVQGTDASVFDNL